MEEQRNQEFLIREALARRGIEVTEIDVAVIAAAEMIYGPDLDALLSADLSAYEPEVGFDPGRPPIDRARGLA